MISVTLRLVMKNNESKSGVLRRKIAVLGQLKGRKSIDYLYFIRKIKKII